MLPRARPVARQPSPARPLGVEQADELLQGHDLGEDAVAVLAVERLVRVVAGGEDDDAGVQLDLARLALEVDPLAADRGHALAAARARAPVDRRHRRVAAGVGVVDGLPPAEGEIELVDRLLGAGRDRVAGVGQVLVDAARLEAHARAEVPHDALRADHVRAGQQPHPRLAHGVLDERGEQVPRVLAGREERVQLGHAPAEERPVLDERDLHPAPGEVARGDEPGHPAADDEGRGLDRDAPLLERDEVRGAGDRRAHQARGLPRRRLAVLDDPGDLLADVDVLEEVLVQAGAVDRPAEGHLVQGRRAGGHHHAVELELPDLLLDEGLAGVGADERVRRREHDPGHARRLRRDALDVHDVGMFPPQWQTKTPMREASDGSGVVWSGARVRHRRLPDEE